MTKKIFTKWIWLFAIIVSIVNIVVVCLSSPRTAVYFDYQGIIIGSLSILVTLLIGWNIYSTVDVKRCVTKLKSSTADRFDEQCHDIEQRHFYTEGKNAVSLMEVFLRLKDYLPSSQDDRQDAPPLDYYIIYYGLMGIANAQKSDTYNNSDMILEKLIQYLEENTFTLQEPYYNDIMNSYHCLSENHTERYRALYRLLINIEGVK